MKSVVLASNIHYQMFTLLIVGYIPINSVLSTTHMICTQNKPCANTSCLYCNYCLFDSAVKCKKRVLLSAL